MSHATPPKPRSITDLALATFLSSRGHELLSIFRDGSRSKFLFAATPDLESDELLFYNRQGRVEPLFFVELLRSLKAAAMGREAMPR